MTSTDSISAAPGHADHGLSRSAGGPSVALYWDFENLHAALFEARHGEGSYARNDGRFKAQEPLVDVQAVVDLAASLGPLAIHRGYCNWQFYGRYRDALLQTGMDLIQMFPPGPSAKNGADIRLCLDAAEDAARFGHIGTVVLAGGDSDFMPLAQKLRAMGRRLVGVGVRANTSTYWAHQCQPFHAYEDVLAVRDRRLAEAAAVTPADGA